MVDLMNIPKDVFMARAADAASLMRVMSNERRLMILCQLGDGELSVSEIQKHLDLSQSALSQHLAVLREANIVSTRHEAQNVFYKISDTSAINIITTLADIFCPTK